MSPDAVVRKINFDALDIFPVFIDYDMEQRRCRGLSAKLDIFSYGAITAQIEKFSDEDISFAVKEGVLIKKEGLLFNEGFFLFDFKYMSEHPDVFIKKITDLGMGTVYVEKSDRFDFKLMQYDLKQQRVEFLEFQDA